MDGWIGGYPDTFVVRGRRALALAESTIMNGPGAQWHM